jgi:hypothetical protein
MSLPLEFTGNYDVAQRNFDRIAAAVVDAGERSASIRFGIDTVTFTASTSSANKVVSHGLAVTPVIVLAMAVGDSRVLGTTFTYTDSSFTMAGGAPGGAISATISMAWLAIG